MKPFDKVRASFHPLRTDDLCPDAQALIGVVAVWEAVWRITLEDNEAYAGDWAMVAMQPRLRIGWVPLRDLEIKADQEGLE